MSIAVDNVVANNVAMLRCINERSLPVKFDAKFYEGAVEAKDLCYLGFYEEIPVGGIRCELVMPEGAKNADNAAAKLYIMSLAVLPAYRRHGIGSLLLSKVVEVCREKKVHEIVIHVSVENEDALAWYKKRGFEQTGTLEGYYKQLSNTKAAVLVKKV
ncbi:hypothetical protein CANCADRAFT_142051 [Tortispora caseinolytica NRRL Y-17796]|uniref:N-acetyltransferase domain-containing protein n=1 Tax=Tortispora caseinolytica NRRL Y-17796 TaxID=767744 RepID=A0A1E4TD29_9ASCO|nr:hypothetical protein CANCADRAFT_142051 [Tortispora caseinolytica NRRL Y-17796]